MVQQRDDGVGLVKVVVPDDHCTQATYRRAVGRRLRTARIVLDISQQEIADAAGCSRNFVSGIERGAQGGQGLSTWKPHSTAMCDTLTISLSRS